MDMLLGIRRILRQALPGLVADMAHDPELAEAIRKKALAVRRRSMRGAFARAAARGEVLRKLDSSRFRTHMPDSQSTIARSMGPLLRNPLRAAGVDHGPGFCDVVRMER